VPSRVRRALVTGASSGLGAEFARQLSGRGADLVLVARRTERLEALAAELATDAEVLGADLEEADDLARVEARLRSEDGPVDLLVNNAGFGAYGAFAHLPIERQAAMVAVNVAALTRLSHAAAERSVERGSGGIINVGSIAGFQPDPHAAVYGASKAFVRSFTEALHEELAGTGVRVMLLAPGVVQTEFQEVADIDVVGADWVTMTAEPVVRTALRDFTRGRAVSVPGRVNQVAALGSEVTPAAVTRRVSGVLHRYLAGTR
jgi:uncharacterized protein